MKEDKVPTSNMLLLKHISSKDDDLELTGTIIQHLFDVDKYGLSEKSDEELENDGFFQYRFNDVTAEVDGDMLQARRIERHEETKAYKRTYQVRAPLETNVCFDRFPFQIVKSTLLIELSSGTTDNSSRRLRPNLHVSEVKTDNVSIQLPPFLGDEERNNAKLLEEAILDKMDKTTRYDFISPYPKVEYYYDTKKEYCPKFCITFYLVESGMNKFVETVLPMLLISTMNTVAVLENPQAENADFIGNASTFALTAVFILPMMVAQSNVRSLWEWNNVYIMLIFLGLTLSSLSESMMHSRYPSIAGMIILWCSLIVPILNGFAYFGQRAKYRKECGRLNDFVPQDGAKKRFNIGKMHYGERFRSPGDILSELKEGTDSCGFNLGKSSAKMKCIVYN